MNNLYEKYKKYYKSEKKDEKKARSSRWLISYADFITVLLGVFIVLFVSNGQIDFSELKNQAKSQTETLIGTRESAGGENLLLDGVSNPSDSKEITVIEFEKQAQQIKDALNNENVEIISSPSQTTIRLGEGVLFDEGSAIIKQSSKKTLDILIAQLSKCKNKIRIEGHCDNVPIKNGQYSSNWELSTIRATNIVTYLIQNGKIEKQRLSATGFADNYPVSTNSTAEGRAKNRRVDIVILN